jgi:hypothetical protein
MIEISMINGQITLTILGAPPTGTTDIHMALDVQSALDIARSLIEASGDFLHNSGLAPSPMESQSQNLSVEGKTKTSGSALAKPKTNVQ